MWLPLIVEEEEEEEEEEVNVDTEGVEQFAGRYAQANEAEKYAELIALCIADNDTSGSEGNSVSDAKPFMAYASELSNSLDMV